MSEETEQNRRINSLACCCVLGRMGLDKLGWNERVRERERVKN